jgi:hypothetical protein
MANPALQRTAALVALQAGDGPARPLLLILVVRPPEQVWTKTS